MAFKKIKVNEFNSENIWTPFYGKQLFVMIIIKITLT